MVVDVIIVGAGPAGSICARHLAQHGHSVALLDKAQFPRQKICGDCLTPRSWNLWQEEELLHGFEQLPHYVIQNFFLSSGTDSMLSVKLSSKNKGHRAVSRTDMDDWLLKEAAASGVHIRQGVRINEISGTHTVVTNEETFESRVLVGADGRNSTIARNLGLSPNKALCRRVAWQTRAPVATIAQGVHMKFFSQGYLGCVPLNEKEANVCVVINQPSSLTPQGVVARYLDIHSPLIWKSVSPLSRKPGKVAINQGLLIGDAARIIEPFTGEGTYMAMRSGQLAAQCISQALKNNTLNQLANNYTRAHHKLYQKMPFHNRLSRWLALNPKVAQFIVSFLKHNPSLLKKLVESNLY
ncbi:MAG: NAD(P)/FAD-dependent oxidoreductase [Blastochloris sp.]|nr:NAD(P)/FAD-dependent oxidoreductase [Blastochloris sp.]